MLILTKILWIAGLVAQGAVLARLVTAGLVRRAFPFFGAWLTWGILSGLILVWVPLASTSYGHTWLIVEPLFILLGFAALWECYRRAVEPYPPADRYFVLALAGALSLTLSLFNLSLEFHVLNRVTAYLWIILFARVQASGTALFLGGLWLVFRQFPIARNANTSLHWRLMFFYGLSNSIAFLIDGLSSLRLINLGNVVSQACSLVLYVLWAWNLSADGEIEPVQPPLCPEDENSSAQEQVEMRAGESLPDTGSC